MANGPNPLRVPCAPANAEWVSTRRTSNEAGDPRVALAQHMITEA